MRGLGWLRRQDPDGQAQARLEVQRGLFEATLADWPGWSGVTPQLTERVWVANRCIQLNAQQIASMPLKFESTAPLGGFEPAWVSSPDPVWFPNGIGDAIFAAVWSMYAYGDAFLLITSRYVTGFPSAWTVLDPSQIVVETSGGRRTYRAREEPLNADDVVQISRDPRGGLRGTSALRSFAPYVQGLIAGAQANASIAENPIPNAILKSEQKLDAEQAEALQAQWVERAGLRRGAPAILPPKLDFELLSFSPKDLLLLEAQEFDARVIASAFGVPPFMLNLPLTGGLTYQNPAMLGEFWWRFELRPCALRISRALSANMLPRGNSVVFDASDTFAPLASPEIDEATQPASPDSPFVPGEVVPLRPAQEGVLA